MCIVDSMLYQTQFHNEGNLDYLLRGAVVIYDQYPYARQEFSKREFLELVHDELDGLPLITCSRDDAFGGVMVLSNLTRDVHIAGTGYHIGHIVVPRGYTKVLPLMLKQLRETLLAQGGSWYNIGQRTGLLTANTRFRRIHG